MYSNVYSHHWENYGKWYIQTCYKSINVKSFLKYTSNKYEGKARETEKNK